MRIYIIYTCARVITRHAILQILFIPFPVLHFLFFTKNFNIKNKNLLYNRNRYLSLVKIDKSDYDYVIRTCARN